MDLERQERVRLFREVFDREYEGIRYFAFRLLRNGDDADNIAKKAFIRLWEQDESFADPVSTRMKLYVLVRHMAVDDLRHEKVIRIGRKGWEATQAFSTDDPASNALTTAEILRLIQEREGR